MASDATIECNSCVFRHGPSAAYDRRGSGVPDRPDDPESLSEQRTEVDMSAERPVAARRISLAAGVLFLITFIASIPALALFQPVLAAGAVRERGRERRGRDLNPRRTEPPETVFETAAFDRSATPPRRRLARRVAAPARPARGGAAGRGSGEGGI
jgi:hypothetical protein